MEELKHECGIAVIRLLKPLEYYQEKYGTWRYGLNKLYLLMEKQHNRGQEGAGIATVKIETPAGKDYMFRERALGSSAITEIFDSIHNKYKQLDKDKQKDLPYIKEQMPCAGELLIGHLRYSTTGNAGLAYVHPFLRRNNWRAKNLAICGNFNMTNVDDIFAEITKQGQHPRVYADTYILLEQIGHRLDREVERLFQEAQAQGLTDINITSYIENNVNLANVLRTSAEMWDGGYVIVGLTGSAETFVMRDPWGIRPAFVYQDDEVVVAASERPVIQTVFDVQTEQIRELEPGQSMLISKTGVTRFEQILPPKERSLCSFERIYFSRGSDRDIYQERKQLGRQLVPTVLEAISHDIDNTVLSFIPNTAEVAYYGMLDGFEDYLNQKKVAALNTPLTLPNKEEVARILSRRIRYEKVAIKDIKLRTFIAEGNSRNDLATHVYDITYGSIVPEQDNLVVIDDSIVRGTTLRQSIIKILDRLSPRKIIIVSSAPQIRYPDYYGIDMPRLSEFCAFQAAIELLKERGLTNIIDETYEKCKAGDSTVNHVKDIYASFTNEDISVKMAQMLTPAATRAQVQIVFQTIEGLHAACPNHTGDWYFSGNYPTPGGTRQVNHAFVKYYDKHIVVKE